MQRSCRSITADWWVPVLKLSAGGAAANIRDSLLNREVDVYAKERRTFAVITLTFAGANSGLIRKFNRLERCTNI